jgi:TRAP-type C4-dicarboxylate transport system permease small subunit
LAGALRILDRALFGAIGLLLGAMVFTVTIQVVFRYVVQDPPVWTEEVARYLFAWEIFLATALAFGRGSHIVVDILIMAVPVPAKRALLILSNLLVLGFLLLLLRYGITMVQLTSNTVSAGAEVNMGLVYASLPTGIAISSVYVLIRLVDLVRGGSLGLQHETMVMD